MATVLSWGFALVRIVRSRAFAVVILSVLLSVTVYAASESIQTVYIHDELLDQPILLHTAERDLDTILDQQGITLGSADKMEYTRLGDHGAEIYIERAFPVVVRADNQTHRVWTTGATVRDVLRDAGVDLDHEDLISLETSEFVSAGDTIAIQRVEYQESLEEEEIPFETKEQLTPLLRNGRREILQSGRTGTLIKTFSERTVEGVVEEATLVAEKVTQKPVTQVMLVGADVPVSDLDLGYSIRGNVPVQYEKVIRGAKAAGYCAGAGARGASGNRLYYGHVAVNPEEIPYGSELYITSSDGSFVYGYAIASDTGLALMQDIIDIDLYYETFRESQLNSIRTVDVYILS